MRILSIVSNPATHDPRVYNEAKALIKGGHNVTVLGWDRKKTEKKKENREEIKIVRIRNSRIMDLLGYDLLRIPLWWRRAYKEALQIYREDGFDVVHCHDLDTLPIGVRLKKRLGTPLVYDAHEIWGYMISNDVPAFFVKHIMSKEKSLLRYVDRIITVNDPLKRYFRKISDRPISLVINAKPLKSERYMPPKNEKFTLVYIGALTPSRFILEMIEAISGMDAVHLILGGKGKEEFVERIEAKSRSSKNVRFLGLVPQEKVIEYTCQADAVVCMIDPADPNNSRALTNKQFEAMVCGRPIITTTGTYSGYFAKKNKCGIVVEYSKEGLKRAILLLKNNPDLREKIGKNALKRSIDTYSWDSQSKKLIRLYSDLDKKIRKFK